MVFTREFIKIDDDPANRHVVVVILVRGQPEDSKIAVAETVQPRNVRTDQFLIVEKLVFEKKHMIGPQSPDKYTSVDGRHDYTHFFRHRPALPVSNLSFENLARCAEALRVFDALAQIDAAGPKEPF